MTLLHSLRSLAVAVGAMLLAPAAFAQPAANTPDPNHPGKAVYDKTCAACHASPAANSRAASFSQITGTAARRNHSGRKGYDAE